MSDPSRDLLLRVRDDCGYTELHSASEDGDMGMVQALLHAFDGKITSNVVNAGKRTALQLAARENHAPVVEKLLNAGADVNFRSSSDGRCALHIAAGKGNNAIVNLLLEAGADKDAKRGLPATWSVGANDKTPLVEAIENGHFPVVETLLSKGAGVRTNVGCGTRDLGNMPLQAIDFAALRGHNDIMIALLNEIGKTDEHCKLEYAIILACREGHLAVVKTLLHYGCDVKTSQFDFDQPLICAAEGGYDAIVTLLLENGADPNEKRMGDDDETPLTMAIFHGHVGAIKALLNAGAERKLAYGSTENTPVMNAILDSGAGADEKELGDFLDEVSSGDGNYEASLMLLRRGAPVNYTGYRGKTPLHQQVNGSHCSEKVVDLLLHWGADETIKDEDGQTPADILTSNSGLVPAVMKAVKELLDNAPGDRRWRRRGWLVMLRARETKRKEEEEQAKRKEDDMEEEDREGEEEEEEEKEEEEEEEEEEGAVWWLLTAPDAMFRATVGFL